MNEEPEIIDSSKMEVLFEFPLEYENDEEIKSGFGCKSTEEYGRSQRNGALAGGAISAVTSLPQVFEQASSGDYSGAAKTFVGNTALGTGGGGFSSAGERIIGNQIGNTLSRSNLAEKVLERLYTSGAARNFTSRLAGTETSNISSQAFNSTLRTVAGRVGGAGVISGGFSAYDQIGAYRRGEVSASRASGTVAGEIEFINFSTKQETFSGNCR